MDNLGPGLGIDAIPFAHPELEKWRTNFTGVQALHKPTNMLVTGAVDDLWENARGELIVVDYKSTAKAAEITELNEEWHAGYKRQVEIYQWLLRQNGFKVSPTAYWVYANGDAAADEFDQTLRFRMTVIAYDGRDDWVEPHIMAARECLLNDTPPAPATKCPHCSFAAERLAYAAKAN
ncbi:MAG: PD-(D/E)XK nuclease family protein [Planctomycetes bacterium]|nr:PD-(D/E)XK nuclease family protein [Planctomycetota bacterium]